QTRAPETGTDTGGDDVQHTHGTSARRTGHSRGGGNRNNLYSQANSEGLADRLGGWWPAETRCHRSDSHSPKAQEVLRPDRAILKAGGIGGGSCAARPTATTAPET